MRNENVSELPFRNFNICHYFINTIQDDREQPGYQPFKLIHRKQGH